MAAFIMFGALGVLAYFLIKRDLWLWKLCGFFIALFLGLVLLSCAIAPLENAYRKWKENAAREAAEKEDARKDQEVKAERDRKIFQREDKLRSFTLKEAPVLWSAYQNLQSEVKVQDQKIEELRNALKDFNRDPEFDADFKRICAMRDEMVGSSRIMKTKIEDAYLAYRKYQATPGRKEYDALRRKLLEDGIQEAEAATRRFNQMKDTK